MNGFIIETATPADHPEMVDVWEASVRATHDFLEEKDIQYFKPLILNEYLKAVALFCVREKGRIVGFLGLSSDKIEMLFVHPEQRGQGIGKILVNFAIHDKGIAKVDVNEQNPQAIGFYQRMGFEAVSRSPVDSFGKPFPILAMSRKQSVITYRRACLADVETLIEQRIEFFKEYMPETPEEKVVTLRRSLDEYYRVAISSEQCVYWLAECHGQSVGGAGLAVRKYAPQYVLTNGLTAYIFNVFTFREYRGRGIATEIMKRLINEARRLDIRRVELHATEMGRPLYEKLGFKPPKDVFLEFVPEDPVPAD